MLSLSPTLLLQGYGYWRTIEPLVAAVDQTAADSVAEVFFLDQAPPADAQAKVRSGRQGGLAGQGREAAGPAGGGRAMTTACTAHPALTAQLSFSRPLSLLLTSFLRPNCR